MFGMFKVNNEFPNEIRENQKLDVKLVDFLPSVNPNEESDFKMDEHGVPRFRGKVCVLENYKLKKMILEESHINSLSIHPGATKMYQDLKKILWWPRIKRDVAQFMYACLTYQNLKVEHHKPSSLMQSMDIP